MQVQPGRAFALPTILRSSTTLSTKARKATTAIQSLHRSSNCLLRLILQFSKAFLTNRNHLLFPLLPAAKTQHYELRTRPHNLTLTRKRCHYDNCNFISRMIFLWCVLTFPLYYFYLLVAVRFDIAFNKHILCVCCRVGHSNHHHAPIYTKRSTATENIPDPNRPTTWGPDSNPNRLNTRVLIVTDLKREIF